ncbi:MAG: hypothetical protein P8R42_28605 [Candidatus Binatia bacterium]|nr:hypothetical protein [Candidatus Binatia bacterium]
MLENPAVLPPACRTLHAAVDASASGGVVCVYARATENVVINKGPDLEITQCTVAEAAALNLGLPVVQILGAGPVLVIGLDETGGTAGWRLDGDGYELRGVRSYDNSVDGILVNGNDNEISVNRVGHNGACGVCGTASGTLVRDNKMDDSGLCEHEVLGAGTTDGGGSNRASGVKFFDIEAGGCFE